MDTNIFHTAVKNLTSGKGWRCLTIPETEEYFLSHFESVSLDENREAQFSNDPSDFGFTWAELVIEVTRLETEYDAQEYARKRKAEYDALNQFELISDDDVNGTTTHKDAIEAVKTKWPKDNSGPVE